jgi:hypothetical protein
MPEWLEKAVTCPHCGNPDVAPALLCTHCYSRRESARLVLEGLAQEMEDQAKWVEKAASTEGEYYRVDHLRDSAIYVKCLASTLEGS